MRVLVLTPFQQSTSIQRLGEELRRAGHEPLIQDPEAPDVRKTDPEFVIPCFGTARFEEALASLEFFERRRVPVLNKASGLREARHRWMRYLVLREEEIPQPPTRLCRKKDLPKTYPFVALMPEPPNGHGIFRVAGPADALSLPEGEWVVQERPADHRERHLLLIDGRAWPADTGALETDLARRALKAMGLRAGSVHLISSSDGITVSEVEGTPPLQDMNPDLQTEFIAALADAVNEAPSRAPLTVLKT